jgi:transcriptional regulator with XRE-family HTH domain
MKIGKNIRKLRKTLRYTQLQFAELLLISQSAISQYEQDVMLPNLKVVNKLVKLAKQNNLSIKLVDD